MALRLSANISFLFPDLPFLDRFAAAARAGFQGVECHWPFDHPVEAIAERLEACGLPLVSLNTPAGEREAGEFGLAALTGREAAFREALALAADYASALACPMIHVMAGKVAEASHQEALYTYVENLRFAARLGEARGLVMLIEPINRRDVPDYFLADLDEAEAVVATVASPALKILADLYHLQIIGGDLVTELSDVAADIGHVQVAAVPSRAEPDEGEVNTGFVLKALEAAGYGGWVGAEYRPRGDTLAGLGWVEKAGLALTPRG